MVLLNFNFVMICIILKILLFLENHLNYLKYKISKRFLKKYNRLLFFFKN